MEYVFYALLLGALWSLVYALVALWSWNEQRLAADERKDVTLDMFAGEFSDTGYDADAIQAAYDDLTELTGYPVHRTDDLETTLCLVWKDIWRAFEDRRCLLGAPMISRAELARLFPVKTAGDYAHLLSEAVRRMRPAIGD